MKNEPDSEEVIMGGGSPALRVTREQAERQAREMAPQTRRRALEDRLGEEFPEYDEFLTRRVHRALDLANLPGDEFDRIMTEEGFNDEKWEPERWRREHAK